MQMLKQEKFQKCIELCDDCAESNEACANACLNSKDIKMLARCIKLNMDCADICRTTAAYMSRDSEYARKLCGPCADVCDICAEECEKHKQMEHCMKCASICRATAEECRRMMRSF